MSADVAVGSGEARRPASREDRATIAFVVLALFVGVVWLLVAVGTPPGPPIAYVLIMAQGPLLIAVSLVTALGISQRWPWAVAVMTPLLTLTVVMGVVSFVVALLQTTLQIPLGTLLGLWALSARPEPRTEPAKAGITGALVFSATLLLTAWPLLGGVMLRPGGPFIADSHELNRNVSVTCQPSVPDQPETITVLYDWSWSRTEPLVAGTDQVSIAWSAQAVEDVPTYFLESVETLLPGVTESNRLIGDEPGVVFAIDLGSRRFEPGDLRLTLQRGSAAASGHGMVEVRARYIHAPTDIYQPNSNGLWTADDVARCSW